MIEHQLPIRVQYHETDQMGVVHHSNYLKYMEIGRIEWLRCLGINYSDMEKEGVVMPVVSVNVNFKHPACFDDVLTLKTRLESLPKGSITFHYETVSQEGILIMTGTVILAFIHAGNFRPIKCPPALLSVFQAHFKTAPASVGSPNPPDADSPKTGH